jgi:hypothetical protein
MLFSSCHISHSQLSFISSWHLDAKTYPQETLELFRTQGMMGPQKSTQNHLVEDHTTSKSELQRLPRILVTFLYNIDLKNPHLAGVKYHQGCFCSEQNHCCILQQYRKELTFPATEAVDRTISSCLFPWHTPQRVLRAGDLVLTVPTVSLTATWKVK